MGGSGGSGGRMFNNWPGAPKSGPKNGAAAGGSVGRGTTGSDEQRSRANAGAAVTTDEQGKNDSSKTKKGKKKKMNRAKKAKSTKPVTPLDQVVASLERSRRAHTGADGAGSDGKGAPDEASDGAYDHCDCSGSEGAGRMEGEGDGEGGRATSGDSHDSFGDASSSSASPASLPSASSSSPSSPSPSSSRTSRSARHRRRRRNHGREDVAYDSVDSVSEVTIQPGGTARVVLHLDVAGQPPTMTCFVVSVRRMRQSALHWHRLCHRGTDACDTTVADEAAVLGMFWMLQALHTSEREQTYTGIAAMGGMDADGLRFYHGSDDSNGVGRLRPGLAPASTPRPSQPILAELAPRVLAYAVLFAKQFGVLQARTVAAAGPGPQALPLAGAGDGGNSGNGNTNHANMPPPPSYYSPGCPPDDRFRRCAEVWLRSITGNHRNRRTLDGVADAADWPLLLYTARVLGDRLLFATSLRTLLERWWINELGQFCDAAGPVRLDGLPEDMRETIVKDMGESLGICAKKKTRHADSTGSLRSARERSTENVINGAMYALSQ